MRALCWVAGLQQCCCVEWGPACHKQPCPACAGRAQPAKLALQDGGSWLQAPFVHSPCPLADPACPGLVIRLMQGLQPGGMPARGGGACWRLVSCRWALYCWQALCCWHGLAAQTWQRCCLHHAASSRTRGPAAASPRHCPTIRTAPPSAPPPSLPADVNGALRAGLAAAVWINRNGERPVPTGLRPAAILSSVLELPSALEQLQLLPSPPQEAA